MSKESVNFFDNYIILILLLRKPKRHWRDPSRIEDIAAGLDDLAGVLRRHAIGSVAIPPLGCGLGGLPWTRVRSLLPDRLARSERVAVVIHEPARR